MIGGLSSSIARRELCLTLVLIGLNRALLCSSAKLRSRLSSSSGSSSSCSRSGVGCQSDALSQSSIIQGVLIQETIIDLIIHQDQENQKATSYMVLRS